MRPMSSGIVLIAVLAAIASHDAVADSSAWNERSVTQLAEGVYEIRHPDAPDAFPQGNTTVILGERTVMVVDSCLLPSAAKQDIDQIRNWTSKPVTWLVNTHWHFDHTLGNATYAAAFPGIQIVAQVESRKSIAASNQGAMARYPLRRKSFQDVLDSGKKPDGTPLSEADRADYQHRMEGITQVLAEFKDAVQLAPNVSFEKELDIDLGGREAQIRYLGRGNTAGDAVVYLPKEKILLTGDLVDHPVPYFFGGFPVDEVHTLEALTQLDAVSIVPGHGEVLHDFGFVRREIEALKTVNAAILKAIQDGKSEEADAIEAARKELDAGKLMREFAGDDGYSQRFFGRSLFGLLQASFNQQRMR
jgi:glyoxylase-like metal-dependent hydrolase (beta-lactamase superfamily II)